MTMEQQIKLALAPKKALVKRRAKGFIKHDYLVPGGPYEEQWDWDAFFIGMALASEIPSEGIYLKNWALNYLENVRPDGFTPGLLTPRGIDKRLKHIKPFLAQGCFFAGKFLQDFSWIKPFWPKLKKSVLYREKKYFDARTGLACWHDGMESGADNNVAMLDFPHGSVAAADLNSFLYREYLALSAIARKLDFNQDKSFFQKKAAQTRAAILKHLWDKSDQTFYNLDTRTGEFIKHITYSNFLPLWAKIAPPRRARAMIQRYLLNPKKLWAKFGVRTLAVDDPYYNQHNIIKPYSNWQGPVWPIANYLYMQALINYGFRREAQILARKVVRLCLRDLKTSGGMHENYHADNGRPLAAPNFVSWNLLVGQMIDIAGKSNLIQPD